MANPSVIQDLRSRLAEYYRPLWLMGQFFLDLPRTFVADPVKLFTSPRTFQDEWFATAWERLGPRLASNPEERQLHASTLFRPEVVHGTVLELGPGGGDQMAQFTPLVRAGQIQHLYAAEPNTGLHAKLRREALRAGFTDANFTILTAGGEPATLLPALRAAGLLAGADGTIPEAGVFNTVISIKVVCSFSRIELEEMLTVLQALLRPGGKFVFNDHMMGEKTDRVTRIYAWWLMWLWPLVVGGCRLDCSFEDVVKEMKYGWKEKKIQEVPEVESWHLFRHVYGWLTKA